MGMPVFEQSFASLDRAGVAPESPAHPLPAIQHHQIQRPLIFGDLGDFPVSGAGGATIQLANDWMQTGPGGPLAHHVYGYALVRLERLPDVKVSILKFKRVEVNVQRSFVHCLQSWLQLT
jgi:hypothetical protein